MGTPLIDRRLSFNGGELSPWIAPPRVDLEKYRSGCSTMRNFRPNVYGGAFRRPGTLFLGPAKSADKKVRLKDFEFSVTTTLTLEFGDFYIRFWTTGENPALVEDPNNPGNPYEVVTPYPASVLFELQFAQINDLVFISHGSYRQRILTRLANNDWSITPMKEEWPATLDDNITMITMAVTGGESPATEPAWVSGTSYTVGQRVSYLGVNYRCIQNIGGTYVARYLPPGSYQSWKTFWTPIYASVTFGIGTTVGLQASQPFFDAGHAGSTFVIKHRRDDPTTKIALNATAGTVSDPTFVLGSWAVKIAVNTGGSWEVLAAVERSFDGVTYETIRTVTSTGVESDQVTGTELEPAFLRLKILTTTGSPPSDASLIIEPDDSYHYGLLYITSVTDSDTAVARVVFPPYDNSATRNWNEPAWSDYRGFPRAVTIHENRIMWGGSRYRPQNVWGSVIDDYFNYRTGSEDDAGLAFRLASDAANGIQWMISQDSLIIGTTGSEWTVGTRETQSALTPSSIAAKRSTTYGSELIQAVLVSDAVLFVQRSGKKIREFIFTFQEDGYTAQDLTLLSEHITDSGIIQIAVQKNPETIVWCITGNGDLIGVVYERGQNVAGWFRYDTGVSGTSRDYFESVSVVSGQGEEDEVWVSVRRLIDGQTVRYIERFQPDLMRKIRDGDQAGVCYVDSAIIVSSPGMTTVSGLDHLDGRQVSVLSNGSPENDKTVISGSITLAFEADTAVVGIPFESLLVPTALETNDPASVTRYSKKKICDVVLQLWKSSSFQTSACNGEEWSPVDFRKPNDLMDVPVPLFTGAFEPQNLSSRSEREANIAFRCIQPLPLFILSAYIKYDVNAM